MLNPLFPLMTIISAPAISGDSQNNPIQTDGQYQAVRTHSEHIFECRAFGVDISFDQSFTLPFEPEHPEDARRVRLVEVAYGGRSFAPDQVSRAAALFASFAAVESVSATCYEDQVDIQVRGIPLHAWLELVRDRRQLPLPREGATLRITPRGVTWTSLEDRRAE